jgi:hypothetical protein
MPFVKHHDMVKAIPPNRTDGPFTISILPRRSWRNRPIPNAYRSYALDEHVAIDPVSIAQQISRCRLPAESFRQLLGNLFSLRISRDPNPSNLTSVMPQDQ